MSTPSSRTGTLNPGTCYSQDSNVDKTAGIRYGVISQRSVSPDSLDQIFQHGRDTRYAVLRAEFFAAERQKWADAGRDLEDFDEDEAGDMFDEKFESNGLRDYVYERDGYRIQGCLDFDLMVTRSPFFTYAQYCSPCVPGAGHLDNHYSAENSGTANVPGFGETYAMLAEECGFPRVYCFGHDWFESGVAPYPVFSVETGKIVAP